MKSAYSSRNKTIRTGVAEGAGYLARSLTAEELRPGVLPEDRTICGDMLEVCPLLPRGSVDLLIADPPYNLTKAYAGETFAKTDAAAAVQTEIHNTRRNRNEKNCKSIGDSSHTRDGAGDFPRICVRGG